MARDVCCERNGQANHAAYPLQAPVYPLQSLLVCLMATEGITAYDRKHIGRASRLPHISIHDFLHRALPLYRKALKSLTAVIGKETVSQVALFKIGYVYKGHPPRIETEHKYITREIERWSTC